MFMLFLGEKIGYPLIHLVARTEDWGFAERMMRAMIIYGCCMTGAFSMLRRYKSRQLGTNSMLHHFLKNLNLYFGRPYLLPTALLPVYCLSCSTGHRHQPDRCMCLLTVPYVRKDYRHHHAPPVGRSGLQDLSPTGFLQSQQGIPDCRCHHKNCRAVTPAIR